MTDYQDNVYVLGEGTVLNGHFMVQEVLGAGGFGITYRAFDKHLDRVVAIKEFYPSAWVSRNTTYSATVIPFSTKHGLLFNSMKEKFIEEAKAMAKLDSSTHVVKVYSYFEENDTAYIVMEFLDGVTLKRLVEEHGKMDPDELCRLMIPLIRALNVVHSYKLIHRDIAPDNIMLMPDRTLKLMDFGAARSIVDDTNKSMSVILKHGFAPFEQYQRRGKQGAWTDVYALSATMYYCITETIPESATDRVAKDSLRRPSEIGIPIRPAIEEALMKGMAKLMEERYQTALEMATAFDRAMLGISKKVIGGPGETVIVEEPKKENAEDKSGTDETTKEEAEGKSNTNGLTEKKAENKRDAREPAKEAAEEKRGFAGPTKEDSEEKRSVLKRLLSKPRRVKLLAALAMIMVLGVAGFAVLNMNARKKLPKTTTAPFVSGEAIATDPPAIAALFTEIPTGPQGRPTPYTPLTPTEVNPAAILSAAQTDMQAAQFTGAPAGTPTLAPAPMTTPLPVPTSTPLSAPQGTLSMATATTVPTAIPTAIPTIVPTAVPTAVPTTVPTAVPTAIPTAVPTSVPTPAAVPPRPEKTALFAAAAATPDPTASPSPSEAAATLQAGVAPSAQEVAGAAEEAKDVPEALNSDFSVGSTVTYGAYEQDNDPANGEEPIQWRVLAREGSKALLISVHNLDSRPYNNEWFSVTWETSGLRKWLNSSFFSTAFTSDQQHAIAATLLMNDNNSQYGTEGGNPTEDRIFLLSIEEAERLFRDDADRVAKNTAYAQAQDILTIDGGSGNWWLRSPGISTSYAADVVADGFLDRYGNDVSVGYNAVRPALWLDLTSMDFQTSEGTSVFTSAPTAPAGPAATDNNTSDSDRVSLELLRTITPEVVRRGNPLTVTYELKNTGTVRLNDIRVRENRNISTEQQTVDFLEPGQSATVHFTKQTVTADLESSGLVMYKHAGSNVQLQQTVDAVAIPLARVNFSCALAADKTSATIGETIVLTLTLTNSGNISYTDIDITEPNLGDMWTDLSLPAGQTLTLTREVTMPPSVPY